MKNDNNEIVIEDIQECLTGIQKYREGLSPELILN